MTRITFDVDFVQVITGASKTPKRFETSASQSVSLSIDSVDPVVVVRCELWDEDGRFTGSAYEYRFWWVHEDVRNMTGLPTVVQLTCAKRSDRGVPK